MERDIMIFITFKILIGFIITLFYIYWKFVYFSPNGTFEYTSVFLNKFLITKDSKLNKLYPTKNNSSYRPRIIQTAIMLFVTIITLILILISLLIMIILKDNVLTTYVYYFSIITAILGFSINIIILIIKIIQMYSCKKKEKLMRIDEINKIMIEISNKQPEFYR